MFREGCWRGSFEFLGFEGRISWLFEEVGFLEYTTPRNDVLYLTMKGWVCVVVFLFSFSFLV